MLLLELLSRVGRSYETVVFVDGKAHNSSYMAKTLQKANIDFYSYQHVDIDKTVFFKKSTQAQSAAADLALLLNQYFDERAELLKSGECAH